MKTWFFSLAAILAASVAQAAQTEITWTDLVDQSAQSYEDPFVDLHYKVIDRLVWIVQLQDEAAALPEDDPARDEIAGEIEGFVAELAEQGHDAEWLLSQRWVVAERRKRAATAGNPEVDGQDVVIGGFAIPAPEAEDGTQVVYLVPQRGMCSHMPPPDANQMIRARMPADWTASALHEPVLLTGRLSIAPFETAFPIVDGIVPMRSTFKMEVAQFETVQDRRAVDPPTNAWMDELVERLRAAGHLPSSQGEDLE